VSVFKRTYRPFTGTPTSRAARFAVLMRYSLADVWSSRITNVLFVGCMVPLLISMATIYIVNNEMVRMLLSSSNTPGPSPNIVMNERYFFFALQGQCWLALVLTAWIGPRLISLDLSNNALPIILSHPISRLEYVLAKFSVLAAFLSAVTWVPILFLFGFQSFMSAKPWAGEHLHIATGAFIGSAIWIILLSLLALAVSSWVRWRIVATAMVFAAIFIPAGMANVFNQVMRTQWGHLFDVPFMMFTLWQRLLHASLGRFGDSTEIPTFAMLLALTCMCAACAMALNARIRAREVVRG
jgi:ABC-type transport system involved in multi-copper enzyme maturation permease subunit